MFLYFYSATICIPFLFDIGFITLCPTELLWQSFTLLFTYCWKIPHGVHNIHICVTSWWSATLDWYIPTSAHCCRCCANHIFCFGILTFLPNLLHFLQPYLFVQICKLIQSTFFYFMWLSRRSKYLYLFSLIYIYYDTKL